MSANKRDSHSKYVQYIHFKLFFKVQGCSLKFNVLVYMNCKKVIQSDFPPNDKNAYVESSKWKFINWILGKKIETLEINTHGSSHFLMFNMSSFFL